MGERVLTYQRPPRTADDRRARKASQETDRRRIVALLTESRVWMTAREVAAIVWGPGTPPARAEYHLRWLMKQGKVKRLARRDGSWVRWNA